MAAASMTRVLMKRWGLLLIGLVITIALAGAAFFAVQPTYQARARVLLLPPITTAGDNPYLDLGGQSGLADVIASRLQDPGVVAEVQSAGATGTYTVVRDVTTSAPILLITGQGKTADAALATLDLADAQVTPVLDRLQSAVHVPAKSRVAIAMVAQDTKASPVRKTQLRAVIGAFALGLVLTVLIIALVERLGARRGRRETAAAVLPSTSKAAAESVTPSAETGLKRARVSRPNRPEPDRPQDTAELPVRVPASSEGAAGTGLVGDLDMLGLAGYPPEPALETATSRSRARAQGKGADGQATDSRR